MNDADVANAGAKRKMLIIRAGALVLLAAAVGAALYAKNGATPAAPSEPSALSAPLEVADVGEAAPSEQKLPLLLDLGAKKCVPCRMMAPILEELKVEYAHVFQTVFLDVWENQEASQKHKVNLIPTQIFFDAEGTELFRHEGFYSKEDILAKWKEFGVEATRE